MGTVHELLGLRQANGLQLAAREVLAPPDAGAAGVHVRGSRVVANALDHDEPPGALGQDVVPQLSSTEKRSRETKNKQEGGERGARWKGRACATGHTRVIDWVINWIALCGSWSPIA